MLKCVKLSGNQVQLLPLEASHAKDLYEAAQAPEIWTYLPASIQTMDDATQFVQTALAAKETQQEFPFVVVDLKTRAIVGSTRLLDISIPNKTAEIGWTWYSPSVWRTAVNTECKYLLLKFCFEELGWNRVQLKTDARNERSRTAILRLGAVQEGILRQHRVLPDGYVRDTVLFSIVKKEWPAVKQRLESFLQAKA